MDLTEILWEVMDSASGSRYGDESSTSIKGGKILHWLSDY